MFSDTGVYTGHRLTASNRPLTDTNTLINTHHDISYTPRSPTHARHERSRTLPREPNKAQPLTRSRLAGAPQTSWLSPPAGCKVQGARCNVMVGTCGAGSSPPWSGESPSRGALWRARVTAPPTSDRPSSPPRQNPPHRFRPSWVAPSACRQSEPPRPPAAQTF